MAAAAPAPAQLEAFLGERGSYCDGCDAEFPTIAGLREHDCDRCEDVDGVLRLFEEGLETPPRYRYATGDLEVRMPGYEGSCRLTEPRALSAVDLLFARYPEAGELHPEIPEGHVVWSLESWEVEHTYRVDDLRYGGGGS